MSVEFEGDLLQRDSKERQLARRVKELEILVELQKRQLSAKDEKIKEWKNTAQTAKDKLKWQKRKNFKPTTDAETQGTQEIPPAADAGSAGNPPISASQQEKENAESNVV